MLGQLLPLTERLLQFAEILRFTAALVQEGISPFDAVPLGANSLSIQLWAYTIFSTPSLGIILPFSRQLVLSLPVVTAAILQ